MDKKISQTEQDEIDKNWYKNLQIQPLVVRPSKKRRREIEAVVRKVMEEDQMIKKKSE